MDDVGVEGRPIKLVLATLAAPIPASIEQAIRQESGLQLLGIVDGPTDLLLAVSEEVDVVVIIARASVPPPGVCSHILSEWAHVRIVILTSEDGPGALYWLGLRRRQLSFNSPKQIGRYIRAAFKIDATS